MTDEQPSTRPKIVVLTPVHNEEDCLAAYEKAVTEVLLASEEYDFEVLFIEDGSTDRSWRIIQDICSRGPRFKGVRLSRNFGSHIALTAGFAHADGDAVATLACDLQDPPETVLEFARQWRQGAKIVWGRRRKRDDSLWRVLASKMFIKLIRRFAMPKGSKFTTGSFLLVDRQVVECYRQFPENNRITFALVAWTGFDQAVVDYDRQARTAGKSSWSFAGMMKAMYDTFVGFSFLPIRLMTIAGLGAFLLTVVLSIYYLINYIITDQPVSGWTSSILTVTFFFGIQFLFMGITGEYLYRIYAEATRRPVFFISDTTDPSDSQAKDASR